MDDKFKTILAGLSNHPIPIGDGSGIPLDWQMLP
jgi:hypothetical protein